MFVFFEIGLFWNGYIVNDTLELTVMDCDKFL